ncbi:hypothetical protein HRbin02_01719 [Candidatus Calditenuaceae archaeon HR02]|nr:hypothetical protein HRbin02_01719 [Candidatus Calditenuaceae archaeon HR02]
MNVPDAYRVSVDEIVSFSQGYESTFIVSSGRPALEAAALLASQEAAGVIVADYGQSGEQYTLIGVVTAREILGLLVRDRDVWRHVMRVASGEISRPAPSLDRRDDLSGLFERMSAYGVGLALINDVRPKAVGLSAVLRYMAVKKPLRSILRNYLASDIRSGPEVLSVRIDQTVLESIHLMLNKGVRRLVVEDGRKILSDRSIIRFLFGSIQNMELARESPERLLNLPLGELAEFLQEPALAGAGDNLETVLNRLLASEAKCCILDDGRGIITPWDLTIKLFQRAVAEARPM